MALAVEVLDFFNESTQQDYRLLEALFDDEDFLDYLNEKAWSGSSGNQPWTDIPGLPTAKNNKAYVAKWLEDHVYPIVKKDEREYSRNMKKIGQAAKSAKVLIDVKKPKSVLDKILRGKSLARIHDILRGAILVKDPEDVDKVSNAIRKTFRRFEEEDKVKGGDKEFGYFGSKHYKVELASGQLAEIQVMTKTLWANKAAAHVIYDQERTKVSADPNYSISKSTKKASKDLFVRGSGKKGAKIHYGPNIQKSSH